MKIFGVEVSFGATLHEHTTAEVIGGVIRGVWVMDLGECSEVCGMVWMWWWRKSQVWSGEGMGVASGSECLDGSNEVWDGV